MATRQQPQSHSPQQNKCRYLLDNGTECPVNADNNGFCEEHNKPTLYDTEVFKSINERLLQDLREYWTRSNFYLLTQGALLSVFTAIVSGHNSNPKPIELVLDFMGFVIALIWLWVAWSSIEWINKWRKQMIQSDRIVDRRQYHSHLTDEATRKWNIPTRITLLLPVIFAISWIILLFLLYI
jgi:hypothetical protein